MERSNQTCDEHIVELFWQRSEHAISETAAKYGDYCSYIAYNILYCREDVEESINDTWFAAWKNMPPHKPSVLSAFLGKITRRISIDKWRKKNAGKRGSGEMQLVLDELEDCIASKDTVETAFQQHESARIIREFLDGLSQTERRIFLRRYWYMDSISVIARDFDFTESKTASLLHRTRKKLRDKLESEGYL